MKWLCIISIVLAFTISTSCCPSTVTDTAPPVISSVSINNIFENSATITWMTDEPADSQVEYGSSTIYGTTSNLLTSLTTAHSMDLSGLTPDTEYHFRVKSSDSAGNHAVSEDYTFTSAAPVVQLTSQEEISDNQVCYTVTIDDTNIPTREAQIRATHINSASGFVALTGGGWGTSWFGDGSEVNAETIAVMHNSGCETYEIKWIGDKGWGEGCAGQGFKETTRAYTLVVEWISDELADNPAFGGIVGTSASSMLIGYGLTVHGLEDILDVVIFTAGPMHSDLEATGYEYGYGMRAYIIDYLMGWVDDGDYCQEGEGPEWTHQALREESIVSEEPGEVRDYDYPNTEVVFIEGADDAAAFNLGIVLHDVITTEKEWMVIPGAGHGVLGSPDAVSIVQQRLLQGLGRFSTDVVLVSQEEIGDNQVCYTVTVDDGGLPTREAQIRAYHNDSSNGAVIFLGGGFGTSWYGDSSWGCQPETINVMRNNGYETYEIAWTGEQGWATGCSGQGYKLATGAFADLVRWIASDIADNPDAIGITGHSGGSVQISYGLAIHGLEDVLDVVVLTGGPIHADLVWAGYEYPAVGPRSKIDYVMGWLDNGDYCATQTYLDWVVQALQAESLVSPLADEIRDCHYHDTKVVFVEGENDVVIDASEIYYDAITSEKDWIVVPGVGHGVPGDTNGAAIIQEQLLAGLAGS
ncbi:fibronectin type III domain-containing protein [Chloroflexota bacterium]